MGLQHGSTFGHFDKDMKVVETIIEKVYPDPHEITKEDLEEKCCQKTVGDSIPCKKVVETWSGYTEEEVREAFGLIGVDDVKIELVGPAGGICGEKITEYMLPDMDCCEGVEPLVVDVGASVDVLSRNGNGVVVVTGGRSPIKWKIGGQGFHFGNGLTEKITSSKMIRVYSDGSSCGTATVIATDFCSSVNHIIKSTQGRWLQIGVMQPVIQYDPASNGFFLRSYNIYGCSPCSTWYGDPCEINSGKYRAEHTSCTCGGSLWTRCGPDYHPTVTDEVVSKFTVHALIGLNSDTGNPDVCGGGYYVWYCHSNVWVIYMWAC